MTPFSVRNREYRLVGWIRRSAALVLAALALFSIVIPLVAPPSTDIDLDLLRAVAPSSDHLLGTDSIGRDMLSRLAEGTRVSLGIGVLAGTAMFLTLLGLGSAVACATGRAHRRLQTALLFSVIGAAPAVWLLASLPAEREFWHLFGLIMIDALVMLGIIGALGGASVFRTTRGSTASVWGGLIDGTSAALPWSLAGAAAAIGFERRLSFLGGGIQPPQTTLGNLLNETRGLGFSLQGEWWLAWPPLVFILAAIGSLLLLAVTLPSRNRPSTPQTRRSEARDA